MSNNALQSLLNPLHTARVTNAEFLAETAASWEALAMSRKDDAERLQDDLDKAHGQLMDALRQRDEAGEMLRALRQQVQYLADEAARAMAAEPTLERPLKAMNVLAAMQQLASVVGVTE